MRSAIWLRRAWLQLPVALRGALPVYLGVRLWLFILGAVLVAAYPPPVVPEAFWQGVQPATEGLRGKLVGPWLRWDALWYVRIAERGYDAGDGSTAFFPLYPLMIRAVTFIAGGDYAVAAMLVANTACLAALTALYALSRWEIGKEGARRALVYQTLFPTAFYLYAPYTESLFLLWVVCSLYAARRERWWLAGATGCLAALTRSIGVLLVMPLAYELWRRKRALRSLLGTQGLALCLIPLGLVSYSIYLGMSLGNPLLWLGSQGNDLWGRSLVWPWETARQIAIHALGSVNNAVDLGFLIIAVGLCVLAFRDLCCVLSCASLAQPKRRRAAVFDAAFRAGAVPGVRRARSRE